MRTKDKQVLLIGLAVACTANPGHSAPAPFEIQKPSLAELERRPR